MNDWAPKGTLAERLLRQDGLERSTVVDVLAPKGTLAERLLRPPPRSCSSSAFPNHQAPKGTLAERLLRLFTTASAEENAYVSGPERDLGRKAIETRPQTVYGSGETPLRGPERDLGRKAIETLTVIGDTGDVHAPAPKGTLAERLLRRQLRPFRRRRRRRSCPERDLGRKAIETTA